MADVSLGAGPQFCEPGPPPKKKDHKLRCISGGHSPNVERQLNGRGSGVDKPWVRATIQNTSSSPFRVPDIGANHSCF